MIRRISWSTRFRTVLCTAGIFLLAWTPSARAQETSAEPPAHISLVEGVVVLERDGRTDTSPASMPLLAGDRVRTQAGRVEILFADGSTLHLDSNTIVDFQSDEVIRLLEGRIRLNITGPVRQVSYRVDAPSAWVRITDPGEYRVAILGGGRGREVELAVLRGAAELTNEDGSTALRAGERAFASPGTAPSFAYVFNSAAWDAFDQWSEARRAERLGVSAEYLPADVRAYSGTFDRYGSWRYESTYGYVWYPTVAVGWRPYYHGRWTHLRPFGWTWIGADPWGWPTHHYGRWGFSAGLWFWIPGRHWSPAWVSWAYAPGYVSWCPLGWNNRPVFSFVSLNVYGGRRYDPWRAWTVVPQRSFGTGYVNVRVNVINATHIDGRVRQAFAERQAAPTFRGYAVPRSQAPIRVAGTAPTDAVRSGSNAVAVSPSRSVGPAERSRDAGAADTFRSRRGSGGSLNGPGFPAPARESREASPVTRTPRPDVQGTGSGERRAVPRGMQSQSPSAPARTQPAERAVPQYERPSPIRRPDSSAIPEAPSASADRYRAVPRREGYAVPGTSNDAGRVDRRSPDAAPWGSRAVPRSAEPPAPPSYRPAPGIERRGPSESRPSGPPPSAAPARPSGPPPSAGPSGQGSQPRSAAPRESPAPRSGGPPAARPRGGQPSSGTAVRRSGG